MLGSFLGSTSQLETRRITVMKIVEDLTSLSLGCLSGNRKSRWKSSDGECSKPSGSEDEEYAMGVDSRSSSKERKVLWPNIGTTKDVSKIVEMTRKSKVKERALDAGDPKSSYPCNVRSQKKDKKQSASLEVWK
ncbi:hypothetical protein Tco_1397623, partial [Tanacetum coccineum]